MLALMFKLNMTDFRWFSVFCGKQQTSIHDEAVFGSVFGGGFMLHVYMVLPNPDSQSDVCHGVSYIC